MTADYPSVPYRFSAFDFLDMTELTDFQTDLDAMGMRLRLSGYFS